MEISIVVPCWNEANTVNELVTRIKRSLSSYEFEIILVDDGSTDGTFDVINEAAKNNPDVKTMHHRRNLGKSTALVHGVRASSGDIIVFIDADLQFLPEDIPQLLDMIEREEYDLANGLRLNRQDPLSRRLLSKTYNWLARNLLNVPIHDLDSGLKAFRREVLDEIPFREGYHRYFVALAHRQGFKVCEVPISHRPRRYGRSKYGIIRILEGSLDLIGVTVFLKFRQRPLLWFGTTGFIAIGISGILLLYDLINFIIYQIPAHNLVKAAIFLLGGLQLLSLGFLITLLKERNSL